MATRSGNRQPAGGDPTGRAGGIPGIEAVARLAGVSTATVSRALRGLPNVSEQTRARVLQAASELDYVTDPSAARLASGRTNSVAVLMPYVGRPFFSAVLDGIEAELRSAGYDLLLYALPDEAARDQFFERMPLRRRVDGVLVVTQPLQPAHVDRLHDLGLPLGTVGMTLPGVPHVGIDDELGARIAVNHLVTLGHERIAMIGGGVGVHESNPFVTPRLRRKGYREALADAGLEWRPDYEVDGEYTTRGGELAMSQLLGVAQPATAVFAQSDRMAFGVMHMLRGLGMSCPDDLSLVGFGDHEVAQAMDLTTIHQPTTEQGAAAARMLLRTLAGESASEERAAGDDARDEVASELLPIRLVVRATTKPPRRARGG